MSFEKRTIIFTMNTVPTGGSRPLRTAGWTESVYLDDPPSADQANRWDELLLARAALLPTSAQIVGYRRQVVAPVGASSVVSVERPGSSGLGTGLPQKALLFQLQAVAPARNKRPYYLRCVPDDRIVGGEYEPNEVYDAAIRNFLAKLSYYRMRGRDLTATTVPIIEVFQPTTGPTVVRVEEPITVASGEMVRILRTQPEFGPVVGGRFQVVTGTTGYEFTILNWDFGSTEGGSVRRDEIIFPMIANAATIPGFYWRAVVRKVGRPPLGFRGRQSNRR